MKLQRFSGKQNKLRRPLIRRVQGSSMLPQYRAGQIVVVWPVKRIGVGDCIVITHDGIDKIKRVAAIDNTKVYILGDNAEASCDSRHFGWITDSCIKGKIIWSS